MQKLLILTTFIMGVFIINILFANESTDQQWAESMFRSKQTIELLPEFDDSYGVVFRDLNQDGLADLYVVRFRNLNRFFINKGPDERFEDFTIQSGLGGNLMPRKKHNLELGASAADFDNNGWPDILITGWRVLTFFRHQGHLEFISEDLNEVFDGPVDANAGVWADINIDGNLDLFITDEHFYNRLLINQGYGRLKSAEELYDLDLYPATSQGAAFADVDGDGYPDLYVCNWFAPDIFYKNINGEKYEPVKLSLPHLKDSLNSNGICFGDIDNDADLDMVVTDRNGKSCLYRNDFQSGTNNWQFTDITKQAGITNNFPSYGCVIADLNNDGLQDIFFTNIGPNQFYLNQGGANFKLIFQENLGPFSKDQNYSTGTAIADLDNDGDLDLFVANKDTKSILYINPLNNKDFIRLHLEGIKSNRDAIGTKIWLYQIINEELFTFKAFREISGGSGYLSFGEPIAHFGVERSYTYRANIRFPSGDEILLSNLQPGQNYFVEEVGGLKKIIIQTYRLAIFTTLKKNFWLNLFLFILMVSLVSSFIYFSTNRYNWKNRQSAFFLVSTLVILYVLFLIRTDSDMLTIILTQIGAILFLMTITTGFMEKIRQIELKRYGYRNLLQQFSQQLILIKNNTELYNQLSSTIQKSMNVKFCVVLEARDSLLRQAAYSGILSKSFPPINLEKDILSDLTEQSIINTEKSKKLDSLFSNVGVYLTISLTRQDKLLALLLIGHPQNSSELMPEDIGLLEILARQGAIAIENNNYIEETKQLTQKVTEAEIQKRYVEELEEKNKKLQKLYQELKQTQSQLIQSEKMAGLGQLVAGVAHELNNPISFVYANMKELRNYIGAVEEILQTVLENSGRGDVENKINEIVTTLQTKYDLNFIQKDIKSLIKESIEGSQRVKAVVENLRNFSRIDEAEFKEVDLHEGLDSTLMLLNNEIKDRIQVHKNYGILPKLECHPGHINQVFMNLILNAVQAIDGKGNIWIETSQDTHFIYIKIKDDGRGIPKEVQNKVFDPFFTTKPVGEGTGLGLSVSYGIIEKHKGSIKLDSKIGEGTEFLISLPLKNSINKTF